MKINSKAILIGYLVGFMGSMVVSTSEVFFYAYTRDNQNIQSQEYLLTIFDLFLRAMYILIKVGAGYITARICKQHVILNSSLLGFITWVISLSIDYLMHRQYGENFILDFEKLETLVVCIMSCLAGGLLWLQLNKRDHSLDNSEPNNSVSN